MFPRLALALIVAALALPAAAAPRPRGKVVRVERTRGMRAIPRVCDVRSDRGGTCLGSQPQIGDVISVLDENGVIADVRITEVTPFSAGGQTLSCQTVWNIQTEVERGDLAAVSMRTIGLVDPDLHPRRAHVMPRERLPPPPSGREDDTVMVAVDRDGDQKPDLVISQGRCDGQSSSSPCLDQWARVGGRMTRVQQTNFTTCGI